MMKNVAGHIARTFALLTIFREHSDQDHRVSMQDLILYLEEQGIEAERKAVSRSIRVLQENGYDIRYTRTGGVPGYYWKRPWTSAEVLVLCDAVNDSFSLSESASRQLKTKLKEHLSPFERNRLPESVTALNKTDNTQVLEIIELLITAISQYRLVEFRYYDLTITKQKRYRRNQAVYRYLPVSILENSGRYYCVFYSEKHGNFANYRIDKMTSVRLCEETADPVRFDARRWAETSFQMYRGDPVTVTLECDNSLIPIVFDQFGRDVLISAAEESSFTVHLKSSVTPTLVSWILMFYDRIRVKAPQELIEQLIAVADSIHAAYNKEKKEVSHERSE